MRNWLTLGLLFLLVWGGHPDTRAQESSWSAEYVLSYVNSAERLRITPAGTENQVLFTDQQPGVAVVDAAASDDGRYFAIVRRVEQPYRLLPLRLIDTQTGTGTEIAPQETTEAIDFAGFEPGGTRVAFSYVGSTPQNEVPFGGGMMIVDAASGQITHHLLMPEVNAAINAPDFGVWAYMDDWTQAGILFTPNCYGCEGVFEETLALWNPDAGTLSADSGVDFSIFGARLPATNEMLYWTQDTTFPYDPQPGYFPIPNVVEYHPQSNLETDGTVIYFDQRTARAGRAYWVLDGVAMLVETHSSNSVFWDVVYRNGQQQRFESLAESAVQFGTPDGFVALVPQPDGSQNLLHYNLLNGSTGVLGQIPAGATYVLARSPLLWGDVPGAPQPFVEVPELDPATYEALAAQLGLGCQGFLPSRLRIGEQARVTPGIPNRLREAPDASSPQVGSIPGEGVFTVMDGPVCDVTNGIAWWYVDYQGVLGWTAEGQGDEYWTEPLP